MKSSDQKRWKTPREWPLFYRLLCSYLLLAAGLVTLASATSHLVMRQIIIRENKDELAEKAHIIAEIFMTNDPNSSTYSRMRNIERLTDAQVIYVGQDLTARRLPRSRGKNDEEALEADQIINALDIELVDGLLQGETACGVRNVEFMGGEVLFAGAPVCAADGTVAGAAILYRPFREIRDIAIKSTWLTMHFCVFAFIFSIGLAFFMSRQLVKPLKLLTATARRMAAGHYGETVAIERGDEIGQLGNMLEKLSFRLDEVVHALGDEKSRLEQILSGIGEGIVAIDQTGAVAHYNRAALELLELRKWSAPARDAATNHREQLLHMLHQAMDTHQRANAVWVTEKGRSIAAEVWPVMGNGNTSAIGAVGLMRDVSEAERLEQMRRDYVANISHELRTPLTGIRGMVEPLIDGYMDTEEEKMDSYNIIYQETLRLEKLIDDMLEMSRLQSGRVHVTLEPLSVEPILKTACRRMSQHALSSGVALNVRAEEALPEVMGNEDRILEVLIILLDNALSFTPSGGEVTVYARAQCQRVYIGVRDTGAGIDPADLPYIWERFYKADKSRLRTTGTGLGLAIAKLAVERMGGSIDAKSEPGKGATFEFFLNIKRETDDESMQ